jgi:alkanesulfonate monooxygenase SsuD/methylene tetrahydromethanopterin reductase-like flavin-dependent oxidoreductase (luciferase family)
LGNVRVGVLILPEWRWSEAKATWQRAEALGFDHAWTYDHIAWRDLRDSTWFSAIPTLTAAALATSTIRLGTLVASPNFRHPVSFAREIVTLDDISGGRLTLGLGAGGFGWDATILGQEAWSVSERANRFAEFTALLDRVLREPETSYEGRFYSADGARSYPGCVQQPRVPLAIAATGARGMRVAAEFGESWVTTGDRASYGELLDPEAGARVVAEQIHRLEDACARAGRDPASIDRIVLTGPCLDPALSSPAAFEDAKGIYAEVGVTSLVVHWPRPSGPFAGDIDALERVMS